MVFLFIIMPPRNTKLKLNTGAEIPAIGFGTWQDESAQEGAVLAALEAGYRHIDTAAVYVHINMPPWSNFSSRHANPDVRYT